MALTGEKISTKDPILTQDAYDQNALMLLTVPGIGNYIYPFKNIINTYDQYVKLSSESLQTIKSALEINTTSENSRILFGGGYVDIGNIYDTSGIATTDGTNYIMIGMNNESGNDGPTLFIGKRGGSYSRLNKNGYYFYNNDGVGLDAYQYATNGSISGSMTQRMKPNDENFYWDINFPNIYFKVQSSGSGYGDIYMNSPTSSAYAVITLGSTVPQFYLGNLPLKTNTGIYGSGYKSGIEFTDDTKTSFVYGAGNELASLFKYNTTECEFKLGASNNFDNVLYFMQPNRESLGSDSFMYGYNNRTNSHGSSQVNIRSDGFYNTAINQTARVDFRWNHGGVDSTTSPTSPQSWLRSQVGFGSYNTMSELRSNVNSTNCYSELQLESSRSSNFVTLRAGYGLNDTRIDLNGTLTRFSMIDGSRLLTYYLKNSTPAFNVDLHNKQLTISDMEVWSTNGTTFLSPSLTGTPTAPSVVDPSDSSTAIATTAFVQNKLTKPLDPVIPISSSQAITPSEGSMYIIIGSGVNVNVVNGTGTFFIQNQAVDNLYILPGGSNTIQYSDISGDSVLVTLPVEASNIASAAFIKTSNGYFKI